MLTGVFPPTYGDIYVNGLSIIEHRSELLEQCGVCNQVWTCIHSCWLIVSLIISGLHSPLDKCSKLWEASKDFPMM